MGGQRSAAGPYLQTDSLPRSAPAHNCGEVEVVAADDALHVLRSRVSERREGGEWKAERSAQTGDSHAGEHMHERNTSILTHPS